MPKSSPYGNQAGSSYETRRKSLEQDSSSLEVYQAFMTGYVRRINEATLKVAIGGIRIGSAKYSRLAQINLKSRIITFSRFAIENVPERGRRYLVIHELAHVKEPSHNRAFWDIVGRYEPNYRQVGKSIQLAFSRNVKEIQLARHAIKVPNPLNGRLEEPKLLLSPRLLSAEYMKVLEIADDDLDCPNSQGDYLCSDDEFEGCESMAGIIYGGSDIDRSVGL